MARPRIAARPIGVKQIPTAKLFANPHNPQSLFDPEPMEVLRQSTERVGILVPLHMDYPYRGKKRRDHLFFYKIFSASEVAAHGGQNVTVKRVADCGFKTAEYPAKTIQVRVVSCQRDSGAAL